jgi:hypothetical protein
MPTSASAGGHRAIRSNLFACGKKYFRYYRLRCSKTASVPFLNMQFGFAKLHAWTPAAIHGGHPCGFSAWSLAKPNSTLGNQPPSMAAIHADFRHGVWRSQTPHLVISRCLHFGKQ